MSDLPAKCFSNFGICKLPESSAKLSFSSFFSSIGEVNSAKNLRLSHDSHKILNSIYKESPRFRNLFKASEEQPTFLDNFSVRKKQVTISSKNSDDFRRQTNESSIYKLRNTLERGRRSQIAKLSNDFQDKYSSSEESQQSSSYSSEDQELELRLRELTSLETEDFTPGPVRVRNSKFNTPSLLGRNKNTALRKLS